MTVREFFFVMVGFLPCVAFFAYGIEVVGRQHEEHTNSTTKAAVAFCARLASVCFGLFLVVCFWLVITAPV